MTMRRFLVAKSVVGLFVLAAGVVVAQTYPSKTVRIVTAEPGGSPDVVSRLIAQGIAGPLGQSVIVDNRGSGVSGDIVSKAPADGHTLLVIGSTFWVAPLLQKTPYD